MTTKTETEPKIEGFIMPPEWLRPMPKEQLRMVCLSAYIETATQFTNPYFGARQGFNAAGNLLRHHGYTFETIDEIMDFVGFPNPNVLLS